MALISPVGIIKLRLLMMTCQCMLVAVYYSGCDIEVRRATETAPITDVENESITLVKKQNLKQPRYSHYPRCSKRFMPVQLKGY